jgi:hypothetical protein
MTKYPFTQDGVWFAPVLHGRLEFAAALRQLWAEAQPQAVAVELPRSLTQAVVKAVEWLPNLAVVLQDRPGGGVHYLLVEPTDPTMEALRLARQKGAPSYLIDAEGSGPYPDLAEPWPDSYALSRLGLAGFVRPFLEAPPPPAGADAVREQTMAHRLQELRRRYERVLFVTGLAHAGRILRLLPYPQPLPLVRVKPAPARPANLHPEAIPEVAAEMPYLIRAYEAWRDRDDPAAPPPDRLLLLERLLEEAAATYHHDTGETIKPWQTRVLRRFRRNWALLSGALGPDFYQLVVSAKGVGGDEFAEAVYRTASAYPWTKANPAWETVRPTAADLGRRQRKVTFFKPLRRQKRRLMPLLKRPQAREGYPGQWAEIWSAGSGVCSHVPEDLVIETFARRGAVKALARAAEEGRRVEPFTASLRDGIDLRETLRRLVEQRVYVYEDRPLAGQVGAVVIIFDPDEGPEERFPWKLTWLGEHQDESDMAFYATPPGQDLVGPGISRSIYGGLVMTYPSRRMLDVWTDPFFDPARTKAERLLLAGADYSQERLVAYLARKPPSARARAWVQRLGRQVAYLPLGLFGQPLIQKIRVFHLLSGHEVRAYAAEYIRRRD